MIKNNYCIIVMLTALPIEIILEIIKHIEHWKDLRSLKTCCKIFYNIIVKNKDKLFEERKIALNFVKFNDKYQIDKNNKIVETTDYLPLYALPWALQTRKVYEQTVVFGFNWHEDFDEDPLTSVCDMLSSSRKKIVKSYLKFVKEELLTNDLYLRAVNCEALELEYVKKQTPEICLIAVKKNGLALQFVENQTSEICLMAVKENGLALQFVEKQTPEICSMAIQQNSDASQFIENETN